MPVVLSINGYRFKFYSNENDESPHIHVMKAEGNAKYWLTPDVLEEYSYGYKSSQRREIRKLVEENQTHLIQQWYEYFGE